MSPPPQGGKLLEVESVVVLLSLVVSSFSGYHVAMGLLYLAAKTSLREVFVQDSGDVRVAPPEELLEHITSVSPLYYACICDANSDVTEKGSRTFHQ